MTSSMYNLVSLKRVFCIKDGLQVSRQRRLQFEQFACDRVPELELVGMQELPSDGDMFQGGARTVDRIANDRVSYSLEVQANLVRAPGLELEQE